MYHWHDFSSMQSVLHVRRSLIDHERHSKYDTCIHAFIHFIGMCRMRRFLAVLSSFSHSSLLYTLSFHPFPPTYLLSSLTSSCHLFLGLHPSLFASKFIYNIYLGILSTSIFCTCPNQRNLNLM